MKKLSKILALCLCVALVLGCAPITFARDVQDIVEADYESYLANGGADESALVAGEDYVAGELLFTYAPQGGSAASLSSIQKEFGLEILEQIDQTALLETTATASAAEQSEVLCRAAFDNSDISVFELCKAMNALETIKDCEPNYIYAPESFDMPTELSTSADYGSKAKWYFDNMDIPQTWEQYSNLGEGALVCVIDNGLNFEHEEIKNRLWSDAEGNHGYNAEFNNHDIYGKLEGGPAHGSHCAGIIAMEASNGGFVGVAPKAKIMACNAVTSSTGYFTNANLIKSLEYAVANGADVISMSLGGYSFSFNMEKALARASMSAVILCAAGNDSLNASTALHYPSASGAVIGVMALGSGSYTNRLSNYSNYDLTGKYYQVAAPGTSIYSIAAQNNTGYVSMTGTSMATPFMAGIAALYVAQHPSLSPTQARHAIIEAAGEMVRGYQSDALSYSFEKADASAILGTTPAAPTAASFADRNVYAKVKEALCVGSDYEITDYDLESVTYLDLSHTSFKNYAALADLPALTYLNLSDTDMSDENAAALVRSLPTSLLILDIADNKLTNLDFLGDYGGYIARLYAANNALNDISAIAKFNMIADLDISSNRVKDISAVASIKGLVYLYAPGNLIEDAAPIVNLPKLEEAYFGNYNPNLADMFGERYFFSGELGNRITSLEPFMQLNKNRSRLHYLNLSYNYIHTDPLYHYHAAKLLQLLDEISEYHDFKSIFEMPVRYKAVLSPAGSDEVTFAEDITFENGRNFTTLYLDGGAQHIPYAVTPANANFKTGVSFAVKDSTVAFVSPKGDIYPVSAGSTYVTLKLESGKVRTFFVNVKESFVASAAVLNPATNYTVDTDYRAVVYTAPCAKLLLTDNNGSTLGKYTADGKYAYTLTDKNNNRFIKWIVPFRFEQPGSYDITATAYNALSSQSSATVGTFHMDVTERFGSTLSGTVSAYNSRFDTVVTLLGADGSSLQTLTLSGGVAASGSFCFTNVANGVYSIKVEKAGYAPYTVENIVVEGDTVLEGETPDSTVDISSCAGDINADASIDIADVSTVLTAANYAQSTASAQNILCDVNADETVSIQDLAIILANMA